jgi:hypothetical protein
VPDPSDRRWLVRWLLLLLAGLLVVALVGLTSPFFAHGLRWLLPGLVLAGLVMHVGRLLARWVTTTPRAPSRGVLGWPLLFLALYVVPVVLGTAAWALGALGGPRWSLTLTGTARDLFLVALALCVLWALLQPLRGARVRSAYARLVARGA